MSKTYVAVQRTGQQDNELTHWKYIKREKKNGKWRYYYAKTKEAGAAINNKAKGVIKDKLGYDEAEKAIAAEKKAVEASKRVDDALSDRKRDHGAWHRGSLTYEQAEEADKRVSKAIEVADRARAESNKASDEFYNTPLGKIMKHKKGHIQDGATFIDGVLRFNKR